jgi:hypothetical protein
MDRLMMLSRLKCGTVLKNCMSLIQLCTVAVLTELLVCVNAVTHLAVLVKWILEWIVKYLELWNKTVMIQ